MRGDIFQWLATLDEINGEIADIYRADETDEMLSWMLWSYNICEDTQQGTPFRQRSSQLSMMINYTIPPKKREVSALIFKVVVAFLISFVAYLTSTLSRGKARTNFPQTLDFLNFTQITCQIGRVLKSIKLFCLQIS